MTTEPANSSAYPHLNPRAVEMLSLPDRERIVAIRTGSWMPLRHAKKALELMEELLVHPRVVRPPNLLLVGLSYSGKSSILERFLEMHPPDMDAASDIMNCPVVLVEAPPKPDISDFYSRILDAVLAPYKPTAPAYEKFSQIKRLFATLNVQMLVVDEIHNLIAGSTARQREFRNALRGIGNETKVRIVAAGIPDAYNAMNTDPQLSSRFKDFELPVWKKGKDMGVLLATLENRTPLKLASDLKAVALMQAIDNRAEGMLGDICDLVREAAVAAIRDGSEQITLAGLRKLDWIAPSKRRKHRLSL